MARAILLGVLVAACERSERAPPPTPPPVKPADARIAEPGDVMLAIDMSKSMEETDLPMDRLDATQRAVRAFIASHKRDRIGLVIYAQHPKLLCALTCARAALDTRIADLRIGDVPELGTAMGDGIGLALDELRASTAVRRSIIVLADGENNWINKLSPDDATAAAKAIGVTIHTLLVGKEDDPFGFTADPKTLTKIASATGGTFYRATDPASFERGLQIIGAKLDAP